MKRKTDVSARSWKTYLTFRINVCSKCSDPIWYTFAVTLPRSLSDWYGVCDKLEMLIVYLEDHIDM